MDVSAAAPASSASSRKGKSSGKLLDGRAKSKAKSRPKRVRSKPTSLYKIAIRKLPIDNFDIEKLKTCIDVMCAKLGIDPAVCHVDHFIPGKLSRKRGPVASVGFVSVAVEDAARLILANCPRIIPLLDDEGAQPELSLAPYQKAFRKMEKVDPLLGTYEADPEYTAFLARKDVPVKKVVSEATAKHDPSESTLLAYLNEKAGRHSEKKSSRKSKREKRLERLLGKDGKSSESDKKKKDKLDSSSRRTILTKDGRGAGASNAIKVLAGMAPASNLKASSLLTAAGTTSAVTAASTASGSGAALSSESSRSKKSKSGKDRQALSHVGGTTQNPEIKSALEESLKQFRLNATAAVSGKPLKVDDAAPEKSVRLPRGAVGLDEDGEPVYLSRKQKKLLKENAKSEKASRQGNIEPSAPGNEVDESPAAVGAPSEECGHKPPKERKPRKDRKEKRENDINSNDLPKAVGEDAVESGSRRLKLSRQPKGGEHSDDAPMIRIMKRGQANEPHNANEYPGTLSNHSALDEEKATAAPFADGPVKHASSRHSKRDNREFAAHRYAASQEAYQQQAVDQQYNQFPDYSYGEFHPEGYQQEYIPQEYGLDYPPTSYHGQAAHDFAHPQQQDYQYGFTPDQYAYGYGGQEYGAEYDQQHEQHYDPQAMIPAYSGHSGRSGRSSRGRRGGGGGGSRHGRGQAHSAHNHQGYQGYPPQSY